MRSTLTATALALLSLTVIAVAQNQPLKFEVATVKPSRPGALSGVARIGPRGCISTVVPQMDRGRFDVRSISLYMLITWAYGMGTCWNVAKYNLITGGEKWTESDLFDVGGAIRDGHDNYTLEQLVNNNAPHLAEMLRTFLAERFKAVVHSETRGMPVYELTVAKNGPKLRQIAESDCVIHSPGDPPTRGINDKPWCGEGYVGFFGFDRKGTAELRAMTLDALCDKMSSVLDRPVIDKTGIAGMVAFHLEWVQEQGMDLFARMVGGGRGGIPAVPTLETAGHSIFSAIQEQVGLKLEATKEPVAIIVIDHAEKPSEN